jgi:hypothetical protein
MPSYSLCASDVGSERVEIGQAIDEAGKMRMADIHIEPGELETIDEVAVISTDDSKGCNSNGSTCHNTFTPPSSTFNYSTPIDPFVGDPSFGNPDCIIATDRCDKNAIAGPRNCFGTEAEPRTVTPQSLSEVCQCIRDSLADPESELSSEPRGPRVKELCDTLETYQSTRGACAMAGCPSASGPECSEPLASCDPTTGATVGVAGGYHCKAVEEDLFQCIADCPCQGYDLLGGGKFLVNTAVSMVRLQLDGLVATPDPDEFTDDDAVSGTLSAFNYLTRTLVESVSFSSLEATRTGSVATFEVRNADTSAVLAGGTGENDRSAFQLTVGP